MKKIKKLTGLLLVAVMLFAMTATAFAAKPDLSGHTYTVYQISKGTQANGDSKLADIEWGTGVDGAKLLEELKKTEAFAACNSASDVAKVLSGYGDKSDGAEAFAKLAYKFISAANGVDATENAQLDAGYYLVVDTTKDAEVYNLALLQLTNKDTFHIENKTDVPELTKKVDDENDSVLNTDEVDGEDNTNWQDSADYDIGDDIPFQLTGTVASNYDDYDTYYFVFHDVEEAGLQFNNDVVVKVDGVEIKSGYTVVTDCKGEDGDKCTFEVVFANLKNIEAVEAGSKITVDYTSKLTTSAVLGNAGNVNKARLEFSNNPNEDQGGKPNTGYTPWDNVIVFTYKVVVNKVDQDKQPLAGAEFTLQKYNAESATWVDLTTVKTNDGKSFEFSGLDAGKYKLVETKAPAGYNKIEAVEFTVTANHNITWEDDGTNRSTVLTALSGNAASGEITFTADPGAGALNTQVVNNSGTTLPETGGVGTIMFYVIGAILMVGAAVVMITRKRMSR